MFRTDEDVMEEWIVELRLGLMDNSLALANRMDRPHREVSEVLLRLEVEQLISPMNPIYCSQGDPVKADGSTVRCFSSFEDYLRALSELAPEFMVRIAQEVVNE